MPQLPQNLAPSLPLVPHSLQNTMARNVERSAGPPTNSDHKSRKNGTSDVLRARPPWGQAAPGAPLFSTNGDSMQSTQQHQQEGDQPHLLARNRPGECTSPQTLSTFEATATLELSDFWRSDMAIAYGSTKDEAPPLRSASRFNRGVLIGAAGLAVFGAMALLAANPPNRHTVLFSKANNNEVCPKAAFSRLMGDPTTCRAKYAARRL